MTAKAKKPSKRALKFIKDRYRVGSFIPELLTLEVTEIAILLDEYSKPFQDEVKELTKVLEDPEELADYIGGM